MPRSAVIVVALVLAAAGCTGDPAPAPEAGTPGPSAGPSASTAASPATAAAPEQELVVVAHATVPQLDLTVAAADRIVAGQMKRWRGFRVVSGTTPDEALRAVEDDSRTIAVVPIDDVGPTIVAARVGGVDPIRDRAEAIDVTLTGDVMLVRGVPDPRAALAPMRERLRGADLTVGNLESTLSLRGEPTQDDFFGGTPDLLGPLAAAGFDALSLANNHTGDYGEQALLDTVAAFRGGPIASFGAGPDVDRAARPAVLEAAGTSFAFLGFNAIGETPRAESGTPGALSVRMPPRTGPLVEADLDRVTRAVRRASRHADVVVVLPHWGEQYTHTPRPVQRRVSRALVRAGADLVVGGHPHWVQGVDAVHGVPIVHSLGNFVFDMDFMEETLEGVLLEATFWGAELKAVRFVPYRMGTDDFAPRPVEGADILGDLWASSTGPYAG